MRVLLELRPALDGHAGIPQETRLLFRSLASLPAVELEGLIQSGNKVLPAGASGSKQLSQDAVIDRQSRIVVALQQNDKVNRLEWLGQVARRVGAPLGMVVRSALGMRTDLSRFQPKHFEDFVWRSMFEKSLPLADRELVTSKAHRVARVPWAAMHMAGLLTLRLGHALYPRLDTRDFDVFVVETPFPGRVSRPTRMIVRYHDAIPLLMPHTIQKRGYHQASHFHALRRNVRDGAWFACVSEATRSDLVSIFPEAAERSVVIPNIVSHQYHDEPTPGSRVPEVLWARRNRRAPHGGGLTPPDRAGGLDYLLVVSTIEPRKNHQAVIDAWERLRTSDYPDLHLVFVGGLGWDHESTVARMTPWLERGGLHLLQNVPAEDLRLLYRHARATVCPSFAEGFDFAGVEAMRSGGAVAASDIPVHREVYGDAALYFSPYAPSELVDVLARLLTPSAAASKLRQDLVEFGRLVGSRYDAKVIAGEWAGFLTRVAGEAP